MNRPRSTCPRCPKTIALRGASQHPAMHLCINGLPWPVRGDIAEAQLAAARVAEQAARSSITDAEVAVVRCETVIRSLGDDDTYATIMTLALTSAEATLKQRRREHEGALPYLVDLEVALLT